VLTGSQLFPHSNPAVVISRHLTAAPPALADSRPELAALDPVLAAGLAKDPNLRFTRCADSTSPARSPNRSQRQHRSPARPPLPPHPPPAKPPSPRTRSPAPARPVRADQHPNGGCSLQSYWPSS
jgi:serine/threonine-protein kinase